MLSTPAEQLLEKELRAIVSRIIEALPPKRQMVYKLVKDEGMRQKLQPNCSTSPNAPSKST